MRDYGLLGEDAKAAAARGLAYADWYKSPVDRAVFKELMRKSDGPAIRDTAIWFGALILSGAAGYGLWGRYWAILPFAIYGVLYGSASDSRWHECGHATAFKTRWMNALVYQIACFMIFREPNIWRWSHARHHTDTLVVGRDPEIGYMRPPNLILSLINLFALKSAPLGLISVLRHATGRLSAEEATFVPEPEQPKVYATARVWLAIFVAVGVACFATGSVLPAMYIGLPTLYGSWLQAVFGATQHAGLDEDVLDHRLNSRTVMMNPLFRFLYWNMNYHVEHHMFPMIPYHALPRLHAIIKQDCPPPSASLVAAYREIIPALLRQRRDPGYFLRRELPQRNAALSLAAE